MIRIEKGTLVADTLPSSVAKIDNYTSNDAREVVYRFLAGLFLYPDLNRLQRLKVAAVALSSDDWWRDLTYAHTFERLFREISAIDEAQAAEDIVNEYNRLFLVKPLAPPHEAFYLDGSGQFRGWIAAGLVGIYAENGLALSPILNELPDHLAVELEFMSHLCSFDQAGDGEMIEAAIVNQRAFLAQHLAKWFPTFAKRVREADPKHHYGATVEATFLFLRSEIAFMASNER